MKKHMIPIALLAALALAGAQFYPPTAFFQNKPTGDVFHDFSATNETGAYTGTAVASGTSAVTNGRLVLSGAANTDNSGFQFQLSGFPVQFARSKQYSFSFEVDLNATGEFLGGYAVNDTSLEASPPTNGILIGRDETNLNNLTVLVRSNGNSTLDEVVPGVVSDGVFGFAWRQRTSTRGDLDVYKNGRIIYSATDVTSPQTSAFMSPSIAFQSTSNTGTQTASFDWVHARWDR
jgi:hypothetical protein